MRFGAYHLYLPGLIKPAPRALAAQLYALKHGGGESFQGLDEVLHLAASGRTSMAADKDVQRNLYRAAGFRVCGDRAVRVDILERLADLIRPAVSYRPGVTSGAPPPGTADGDGFVVTVAMTSLAGCSGESFASILHSLGYASEQRKGPAIAVHLLAGENTEAQAPPEAETAPVPGLDIPVSGEATQTPIEGQPHLEQTAETSVPGPEAIAPPCCSPPVEENAAESGPAASVAAPAEPDASEAPASAAPVEAEIAIIEIWRPFRQPHSRRPEAKAQRKKAFERQSRPPAVLEKAAPEAPSAETAAGETPASAGTGEALQAQSPAGPPRKSFEAGHKPGGERSGGQPRPRFKDQHGRNRPGEQNRGGPDERREGRGERLAVREKRPERPPDPDSPFAKLLALKVRLEEKTQKQKDNQD